MMYIFHPMLERPMGMTNVRTRLKTSAVDEGRGWDEPDHTHANAFKAKVEKAIPLARIE